MKYVVQMEQIYHTFIMVEADTPCDAMREARFQFQTSTATMGWKIGEAYAKDVERYEE